MKKSLLALAALTAFAGVASAQSSVTIFGIVDLQMRNVSNTGGSVKSLSTDGYNSSRLGFRGVEDLGGGLRAGFWLEAGMAADSGNLGGGNGCSSATVACPTNGTANIFNRRATASLIGRFGEIRLGRDYTPSFWNTTVFDPFGTNGLGAFTAAVSTTLGSNASTYVRANNTVGYFLPAMGGMYGQVMVAAAENNSVSAGNKYIGGRLGYAGGPVNFAGAIGKTTVAGSTNDKFTHINLGGSYKAGPALISLQWGKTDWIKEEQKHIQVGLLLDVGPGQIRGGYTKATGSSATLTKQYDATLLAAGYIHNLSKRTALYGTYSRINNDGTSANGAAFTVGGPGAAMTRGDTSSGYEFGMRHAF